MSVVGGLPTAINQLAIVVPDLWRQGEPVLRLADALVEEERHRQGPFGPVRILPNGQPVTYAEAYDPERYDAANKRMGGR